MCCEFSEIRVYINFTGTFIFCEIVALLYNLLTMTFTVGHKWRGISNSNVKLLSESITWISSQEQRSHPGTQASTPDSVHSPASLIGGDLEVTFLPQVLPWPYRCFSLVSSRFSRVCLSSLILYHLYRKQICSSPVFISDHSTVVTHHYILLLILLSIQHHIFYLTKPA